MPTHSGQATVGSQPGPVVLILGASFETANLGVGALAASAVSSVLQAIPGARVRLLDYGKKPLSYQVKHAAGTSLVELINLRFSWRIYLPNNVARLLATAIFLRCIPSRRLRQRIVRRNVYLSQIRGALFAGSLAGGDSFSDIYGLRRLFYVALPQLLVLALGKPLVLLPQTVGPFHSRIAKWLGVFIMRFARKIYSRDEGGLPEIQALLGADFSKATSSFDLAFQLLPTKPARVPAWLEDEARHPLVGFNVSGLLYHGGYSRNNMFGLRSDYRALVSDTIKLFINHHGAQVMLFPHVYGPENSLESDRAACAAIFSDLKGRCRNRLHLLEGSFDQHEIKYLIGRCDFVLGSRMHACIAALSQDVPAIGLAYSKKFSGVLRSIGIGNLVVDLRVCESARALRLINEAYLGRKSIRADLAVHMPRIRRIASELFTSCLPLVPDDRAAGCPPADSPVSWVSAGRW